MDDNEARPGNPLMRRLPLAIILIAAAIGFFMLRDVLSFEALGRNREALAAFRDANYAAFALAFIAAYVVIVAFSLPGAAVASITGGLLFGLWIGTAFNVVAATIGACAIFLAARLGLGDALAARMDASEGRLKAFRDGLRENEISYLFLMRLVPAVPFFVANLLPALVGVGFARFAVTTLLGIIPGAIVYTWIGVGVGEVLARGEEPDLSLIWEPHVIGPILGLCALACLPIALKRLRGKETGQ